MWSEGHLRYIRKVRMSDNLDQFRSQERVKLLILKHKGELSRVVEESGSDLAYVRIVANKLKKERDHNIAIQVAQLLATEILDGHDARVAHLRDALYQIQLKAAQQLSQCCKAAVRSYTLGVTDPTVPGNHELHFICTQCQNECFVNMSGIDLNEYRKLLNQWLLEDQSLAEFAEKMGLTFKEEQPSIINKHYNVAMINNAGSNDNAQMPDRKTIESHQLDSEGKELIKQAEDLTPITRELLRKSLEEKMLEEKKKESNG